MIKALARKLLFGPAWRRERGRLSGWEGRYPDQRMFIIGNGPSIASQDLLALRDEITFVTNHFLQYDKLEELKPTFYCASDPRIFLPTVNRAWLDSFLRLPESTVSFLPLRAYHAVRREPAFKDREIYFMNYQPIKVWERGTASLDVTRAVWSGDTIVIDFCLPLAHYMGAGAVYLLGCDMDYGLSKKGDYSAGYFYDVGKTTTERQTAHYHRNHWYDNCVASYEVFDRLFRADGRTIYNATAGGRLEVFPRAALDDLVACDDPSVRRQVEK